jgi:RHS repeat-associated protein
MAASFLNSDLAVDVATVVPGTNQVLVLMGLGDGTFAAPAYYSSGGDEPVAAVVGDFVGDRSPDIAVGHLDGTLTFLAGSGGGTFQLRSDLTISGLGPISDLATSDIDHDGDADIAVVGGSQARLLLQDADPLASPPIENGDFSFGLTGWTTEFVGQQEGARPGSINAASGFAQFTENESFLTSLKQSFVVPANPQTISVDILSLGLEAPSGVPDAFEISLLDAAQNSLVPTHRPEATSFFNANPGSVPLLASGVTFDGKTVTVDISGLAPGSQATLIFDLVGNPGGTSSVASIDNVTITPYSVLSETFTNVPLAGPFTDVKGVASGDVDGDSHADLVISDAGAERLVIFNGDAAGSYTRSEFNTSSFGTGPAAIATGRLTAGDSADDIAVALFGSSVVLTPLLADFNAPSPMFMSPAPGEVVTEALATLTIQFSEAVQDNGPAGNHSVTNPAAYSIVGAGADGQFDNGDDFVVPIASVTYDASTFEATISIAIAALPLGDGAYRLTVDGNDANFALRDAAGNPLLAGSDAALNFVLNTPPEISAPANFAAEEGDSLELTATFSDPGFLDSYTAVVNWGDGTSAPAEVTSSGGGGSVSANHVYGDNGSYTITVTLTDAADNQASATSLATIDNVAPTLTAAPDSTAQAGTALVIDLATFMDPGFTNAAGNTQETFTATVDWGDGTTIDTGTVSVSPGQAGLPTTGTVNGTHVYESAGTYTATVTLSDDDGGVDSTTLTIFVNPGNFPPTILSASDVSGAAGEIVTFVGEFTDDEPLGSHTAVVDWGDGETSTAVITVSGDLATATAQHIYDDDGEYTITFTVVDSANETAEDTATATITNTAPWVVQVTSSAPNCEQSSTGAVNITATFADAEPLDTHTATIDWGDGTTTNGNVNQVTDLVTGSHTYANGGAYTITITITDDDGASTVATTSAFVIGASVVQGSILWIIGTMQSDQIQLSKNGSNQVKLQASFLSGDRYFNTTGVTEVVVYGCAGSDQIQVDIFSALVTYVFGGTGNDQIQTKDGPDVVLGGAGNDSLQSNKGRDIIGGGEGSDAMSGGDESDILVSGADAHGEYIDAWRSILAEWRRTDVSYATRVSNLQNGGGLNGSYLLNASTTYNDGAADSVAGQNSTDLFFVNAQDTKDASGGETVVTSGPAPPPPTKYFVVDGLNDRGYRYDDTWTAIGNWELADGATARGVTTTPYGDPLWVVKSNQWVYVYDTDDNSLLGSWDATDLDAPSGIAVSGSDIWIVDSSLDRVYRYAGGAAFLSGAHGATSSFALAAGNTDPSDIATDGTRFWVTDKTADKVFVYSTAGGLLGSWLVDSANADATGIAMEPGTTNLWIADYVDSRVYRYTGGTNWTSGSHTAASSFALSSDNLRPEGIADPVSTMNIGDIKDGKIETTTQVDDWLFDATAGQRVYFDALAGDRFAFQIDLFNPSGGTIFHLNRFEDIDVTKLLLTGQYTFRVRSVFGGLGEYKFQFVDVADPVVEAIFLDESYNRDIEFRGEEDHFTFAGTAGQQIYIDTQGSSGGLFDTKWRLMNPNGTQLASFNRWDDGGVVKLPTTGTYTFVVDGDADKTPSYQFELVNVPLPVPVELTLNEPLPDNVIAIQGEEDHFTFNGVAGQKVYIDAQQGGLFDFQWRLLNPSGTVLVKDNRWEDSGPVTLPVSGQYTFVVDGSADFTGNYLATVWDLPPDTPQPLPLDTTITGTAAPTQTATYEFTASAGDVFLFDVSLNQNNGLRFTLEGPDGAPIFANEIGDQILAPFTLSGTYRLRYAQTGTPVSTDFAFRMQRAITPPDIGVRDSRGTEFWLAFPPATIQQVLSLYVAAEQAAEVTVTIAGIEFVSCFNVAAAGLHRVDIPFSAVVGDIFGGGNDTIENKGVHVSADAEVTVYAVLDGQFSSDAYLGLPEDSIGTDYLVLAYSTGSPFGGRSSQITLVATEDDTTVTITPSITAAGHPAGVPYNVFLEEGQTYRLVAGGFVNSTELTGTEISSDKPVTLLAGHPNAFVPLAFGTADHIVEQLPSLDTWGRRFFTVPLASRFGGDTFRFMASEDDTTIVINGQVVDTLDRGEVHERIVQGQAEVISNNPILAMQYANGSEFDDVVDADPFMMVVNPHEQYLDAYTISTPTLGFNSHFINLVVANEDVGGIMLDGSLIAVDAFVPIGMSGYSGAQIAIQPGDHRLTGAAPFGVYVYGFGEADSYGYPGGSSLAPIALVTSVDATPDVASVLVGGQHTVTTTVTDTFGAPVAGVRVDVVVTGANPTRDFLITDAAGQVTFVYTGDNLGTDTISVSVGSINDTVTADWITATPFIEITSPDNGAQFAEGSTTLVTGRALPGPAQGRIVAVLVDGRPVDALDAAGNFFTSVPIATGTNTFAFEAIDQFGVSGTTTVTLFGVSAETIAAAALSQDVTVAAQLTYAASTFNRSTNTLHTDVRLTNESPDLLAGPVQAVYSPFRPLSVELANPNGALLTGEPFITFDTELPAAGLAAGATSGAIALQFSNERRERFDFDVRLLALANRAPEFSTPPGTEAIVDKPYSYAPSADDGDGNPVSFALETAPAGMVFNAVSGQIEWTPTAAQEGTHQVVVVALDGFGGRSRQAFHVRTRDAAPNRPPQFTSPPITQIASGADYDYTPTVFDPDGQTLTFTLEAAPAGAQFNTSTGQVTVLDPPDGTFAVAIRASDGIDSEVQEFVVRVGAGSVNAHVPILQSPPPTEGVVDSLYFYQPVATDDDPGDTLTFSLVTAPPGMQIDTGTGRITWTPTAGQLGPNPVLLTVSDGNGGVASQSYTIVVTDVPANQAPTIDTSPSLLATENELYSYTVVATDPEGAAVTYELIAGPAGMLLDEVTGVLMWTPTTADVGQQYTVEIHAVDPFGLAGVQTYQLDVRATNTAPVFESDPVTTVSVSGRYRYDADAVDAEDGITYSLAAAPFGMTVSPRTGLVFWNPNQLQLGDHEVVIRATDDRGLATDQPFTVTVAPDTLPPEVTVFLSETLIDVGDTVRIDVAAFDDVAVANVTLTINGVVQTLDGQQGVFYTATAAGLPQIIATATDTSGNIGTGTPNPALRVIDPNDDQAPLVEISSPDPGTVVTYLTDIIGTVSAPDLEFYRLEYSALGAEQWTVFAQSNAQVTDAALGVFDPTMLANDAYDIRLYAQDVSGNVATEMITVSIEGQAKLGNFRLEFNDLTIPLADVPITISRIYDTFDVPTSGDFGFGWSLGLATARIRETVRLSEAEAAGTPALFGGNPFRTGTRVYLNTPDGRRAGFTFDPVPEPGLLGTVFRPRFTPDPGVFEQLEVENVALSQNPDGTFGLYMLGGFAYNPSEYTLITKDQLRYRYDQFDGLRDITDRNGNVLTYTEDGIFSSTGTSIEFVRDDQGRIAGIVDPAGNSILYDYDAAGNLVMVTDQVGVASTMTYHADRAHFLNQVFDTDACGCGGSTLVSRTEYDDDGRVAAIYDALGNPITQTYDLANNREVIADRLGNETTLIFDDRGNILQEIDPLGGTIIRVYDANDNEVEVTDQRGHTTLYTYDDRGNVTSRTNPLDGVYTTTYNERNDVTSTTDELGRTSTVVYDTSGNAIELIDAAGNSVHFTYDARGRITSVTDRNSHTTSYVYGASVAPEVVIHPDLSEQHYEYNHFGLITSRTDELGNETTFVYDGAGKLLSVTDALDGLTTVTYDGNLIASVTDPLTHTTSFEYDDAQRLIREIDALGGEYETLYNANGDIIQEIDPLGRVTTYAYRPDRLLGSITDPLGKVTTFGYDAAGNQTSVTDPHGDTTTFVYDELNRLTKIIDPLTGETTQTYDAVGNLLSITDALGRTTSFTYNALDFLLTETDPRNAVTQYGYDDSANLTSVTDPLNNVTGYVYDNRNRLIEQVDPLDHSSFFAYDAVGNLTQSTDRNGRVRTFDYDELNRLTTESWVDGGTPIRTIQFTYDAAGNLLTASDPDSSYTFTYDALNRLLTDDNAGTPGVPNVILTYGYNAVGNVTSVSDNFGVAVGSAYDARDLLVSRTWQGGGLDPARIDFGYDDRRDRTSIERFADVGGMQQIGRSTFTYDANRRLSHATHFDALDVALADYDYDYDLADQLIQQVINGNTSDYTYDAAGQLTDVDHSAQADEGYVYDANGNRTAGTVIGPNNRLLSDGTFNYTYDNEGNLVTKTEIATGVVTEFTYDHRGRLTRVERRDAGGAILSAAEYTYDIFDRRIAKTVDSDGDGPQASETTRFVYDGEHVWADFDESGSALARYLFGDQIDELLARHRAGEGTAWYLTDHLGTVRDIVDAAGALINHIDYDSFGNVVAESNPAAGDRFKFTGREFDAETGLYYYRARYYDAAIGRFLSEDPLGFDAGDANLYRYVGNAPTIGTDPFGLTAVGEGGASDSNIPRYAPTVQIVGCLASEAFFTVAFAAAGIPPDASDAAGAAECFVGGVGKAAGAIGDAAKAGSKTGDAAKTGLKGGGKTARKKSRDALENARDRVAEAQARRDALRSKPNKTPADKQELAKAERALKKARDQLKASETHARKSQKPPRRH